MVQLHRSWRVLLRRRGRGRLGRSRGPPRKRAAGWAGHVDGRVHCIQLVVRGIRRQRSVIRPRGVGIGVRLLASTAGRHRVPAVVAPVVGAVSSRRTVASVLVSMVVAVGRRVLVPVGAAVVVVIAAAVVVVVVPVAAAAAASAGPGRGSPGPRHRAGVGSRACVTAVSIHEVAAIVVRQAVTVSSVTAVTVVGGRIGVVVRGHCHPHHPAAVRAVLIVVVAVVVAARHAVSVRNPSAVTVAGSSPVVVVRVRSHTHHLAAARVVIVVAVVVVILIAGFASIVTSAIIGPAVVSSAASAAAAAVISDRAGGSGSGRRVGAIDGVVARAARRRRCRPDGGVRVQDLGVRAEGRVSSGRGSSCCRRHRVACAGRAGRAIVQDRAGTHKAAVLPRRSRGRPGGPSERACRQRIYHAQCAMYQPLGAQGTAGRQERGRPRSRLQRWAVWE